MKPKTKLKDLEVKKVDVVDIGADQKADIVITKRDAEGKEPFYKRFFQRFCEVIGMDGTEVRKAVEAEGFGEKMAQRKMDKVRDEVWNACYALQESIASILLDPEVTDKTSRIGESIDQFSAFAKDAAKKWSDGDISNEVREPEPAGDYAVAKMQEMIEKSCSKTKVSKDDPDNDPEDDEGQEDDEVRLDVEKMTPAEKMMYEDLQKRYAAEGSAPEPESTGNVQEEVAKAVKAAMEEVTKGMAAQMNTLFAPVMKKAEEAEEAQMREVAKKYEILGTKPEQLVPVLKSLKATSAEAYDSLIASMDANVEAMEKSGLFSEIGKSGHDTGAGSMSSEQAWATIEKKASDLMVKEPELTQAQAIDMVCQANPMLVHAYETK